MDVPSCMHDFIITNKLCTVPVPEKMNIATTGLSVVGTVRAHTGTHGRGKCIERGSLCAECVL